eukprot:TRINITY_DN26642_c0_g1_i1.p1 TRINITY_DN26642_c0_g1~~TRINITY_DN26642_c0_g1_i1.p1  ORF type:complete len:367 (-),score=88.64 TRINITY_DN26642_c0_g1_i1:1-1101(-)
MVLRTTSDTCGLLLAALLQASRCGAYDFAAGRVRHVIEGPFLAEAAAAADAPEGEERRLSRVTLSEIRNASTGEWSGHRVWPGAVALLEYIHRTKGAALVGMRVLELGCGLPFLAAALAALGAEVCATDHPDALPLLEALLPGTIDGLNAAAKQRLRLRPLAWGKSGAASEANTSGEWSASDTTSSSGEEQADADVQTLCNFSGKVDLIVGADLVYDAYPWEPLKETVASVLSDSGATAILALQPRRFPMVSTLGAPPLVPSFVRSLSGLRDAEGKAWEVTVDRPGSEAKKQLGQKATEGLMLVNAAPPRVRKRSKTKGRQAVGASAPLQAVRYFQEALAPDAAAEQGTLDAAAANAATKVKKLEL